MSYLIFTQLAILFLSSWSFKLKNQILYQGQIAQQEKYRPDLHFTPKKNWMNDPNGLFFFNETYNLYFQYFPNGTNWGPMHWGHATSQDLYNWKQQPIALYPDQLGYIFSGSAVVDVNNTSGFGTLNNPPIVAIFTHHNPDKQKQGRIDVQYQSIAYSIDGGMTFIKFLYNPVISNPGIRDFRDPNVNWYPQFGKWILVLAAHDRVMFYQSQNLKQWKYLSQFGSNVGHHGGVWQCPDLMYLKVQNSDIIFKWILLVSINPGGPNEGSATQYFIGDFDGQRFNLDAQFEEDLKKNNDYWIDFGRDNYAGVTFKNMNASFDSRYKMLISWMSNWQYSNQVPTSMYRNSMTIPRIMALSHANYTNTTRQKYRIQFYPSLLFINQTTNQYNASNLDLSFENVFITKDILKLNTFVMKYDTSLPKKGKLIFKLFNSLTNQFVLFGLDINKSQYFIDRTKSGDISFSDKFANPLSKGPLLSQSKDRLFGCIIFDKSTIQLFFGSEAYRGRTVLSEIVFPTKGYDSLSAYCQECNQNNFQDNNENYEDKRYYLENIDIKEITKII